MSFDPATGEAFRKLVKAWRRERHKEELQELEGDLLPEIKQRINTLQKKISENEESPIATSLARKEKELVQYLIEDLIELRVWKILRATLKDEELKIQLPTEKSFAKQVKEKVEGLSEELLMGKNGMSFASLKLTDFPGTTKKGRKLALVSANKPIQSFVTEEGKVYRNIQKGDILHIPEKNLKLFKKRDSHLFDQIKIQGEEKEE